MRIVSYLRDRRSLKKFSRDFYDEARKSGEFDQDDLLQLRFALRIPGLRLMLLNRLSNARGEIDWDNIPWADIAEFIMTLVLFFIEVFGDAA